MNEPWRITLLGGLRAQQAERVVSRFSTQKTGALLAYLAFYRERSHPREVLVESLWPQSGTPEAGRASLSVALSSLRHQFEPPGMPAGAVILADRFAVQVNPDAVTTDAAEFEAVLKAAGQASSSKTERAQYLQRAVELYAGPLLPGYYEEWIAGEQERLANLFADAVRSLIRHLEQTGEAGRAVEYARRAVQADPVREEFHRDLIRLLAAAGQPDAALRQYRDLERILDQELADEPSEATRALVRRIETQPAAREPMVARPTPPRLASAAPVDALPTGTVTFLFTDIEGSTALWERAGDAFRTALATHHTLLRRTFRAHGGHEIKEAGDSFLVAFARPSDALACAVAGQQALAGQAWAAEAGPLRVRMALHTGEVALQDGEYHGLVLHRASRMLTAAHGGQILCSEVASGLLQRDPATTDVRLSDLGIYRLRDVPEPARLFQVEYPGREPGRFPPLNAEAGYASSLPLTFTRFFGREKEIERLTKWLRADDTRLVTLTGPGGTGKTRLSLETAGRLVEHFSGAVTFVPLADLSDPRLIVASVVDALRLPRSPQQEPLEQAVEALRKQPSLLVLDNFEQLVEEGATIVRTLLERVPGLTLLITSRQLLGLSGEREFAVPPLPTPSNGGTPEQLGVYESVQLFIDRAQTVRPDFQVTNLTAPAVAALCDRLEGIPLAIELAAARAQVLTPTQMLAQLSHRFDFLVSRKRDANDRHRTLRAAIDWSYRLLSPDLQRFFAHLSVFHGGWTAEAAEAVTGEPLALDFLAQLRECSLVLTEESETEIRFRLMESLREYARDRLREMEDAGQEPRQRHANYFLERTREHLPRFRTPEEALALTHLEGHAGNLREAMAWAREAGQSPLHAETALAIGALLHRRGNHREAVDPIQEGLDVLLPLRDAEPTLCAHLLRERAGLHLDHGEWAEARSCAHEALAFFAERDDTEGQARAENLLGQAAMHERAFDEARERFSRALAHFERAGVHPVEAAIVHNNLGLVERRDAAGDKVAALHHLEEALRLRRAHDDRRGLAETLNNLGVLAHEQGDLDAAWQWYAEAARHERDLRHTFGVARALANLGEVAHARGEGERACRLFGAAERLFEEVKSAYTSYAAGLLADAAKTQADAEAALAALRRVVRERPLDELADWAMLAFSVPTPNEAQSS